MDLLYRVMWDHKVGDYRARGIHIPWIWYCHKLQWEKEVLPAACGRLKGFPAVEILQKSLMVVIVMLQIVKLSPSKDCPLKFAERLQLSFNNVS